MTEYEVDDLFSFVQYTALLEILYFYERKTSIYFESEFLNRNC
jgi:hypothetical protein